MAKISARGATKVAQASKTREDSDGYRVKTRVALRSDGKVLQATDVLSPTMAQYGSRGWSRGSYSIRFTVPVERDRSEWFRDWCARNGYEVTR